MNGHARASPSWSLSPIKELFSWALSIGALLLILLSLASGYERQDVGAETRQQDGKWVITRVTPESTAALAGLRLGDIIVAVDGAPPGSRRYTNPGLWLGESEAWTVLRGTEEMVLRPNREQAQWHHVIEPALMSFIALAFWGFAAFVSVKKPRDDLVHWFHWLNVTIALELGLSSSARNDALWAKGLGVLAFALLPALFVGFFLRFAHGSRLGTRSLLFVYGLAISGLGIGALYVVSGLAGSESYDLLRTFLLILLALAFIVGLLILVQAYIKCQSERARQQQRSVLLGASVAVLPLTLLSLIPESLGQPPVVRAEIAALSAVAFPASVAYSILRHGLLGIDIIIERTLVYGVMTILLAGCYSGLIYLLLLGGNELLLAKNPTLSVVFFAVVTITFVPIRNGVRRLVDSLVYRDRRRYIRSLRTLSSELASIRPLGEVLSAIADNLRGALNLRSSWILLRHYGGELEIRALSGDFQDEAYIRNLVRDNANRRGDESSYTKTGPLVVPLLAHGQELGMLCLVPKKHSPKARLEYLGLAEQIADQLAIAIVNDLLAEQLRERLKELELLRDRLLNAQEQERKRLALDLHDGALHTVLELGRRTRALMEILHVADGTANGTADVTVELLEARLKDLAECAQFVANELRGLSTDLYPSELTHLGLPSALEGLVRRVNRDEGVIVHFTSTFPEGLRLHSAVEDTLYRVAREALDNVSRHSGARIATLNLGIERGQIVLSVQDDGRGFIVPASPVDLLRQGHIGMISARERVENLHGKLVIESAPRTGTLVRVHLPRRYPEKTDDANEDIR